MLDLSHLRTDRKKKKASASNTRALRRNELEYLLGFVDKELEEGGEMMELRTKSLDSLGV